MATFFFEARPAFIGEGSWEFDVTIDGTGDLTGWTFDCKLFKSDGTEVASAMTATLTDITNRIATAIILGQATPDEYRWWIRRNDDSSEFVVAHGAIEVMDPAAYSHWLQIKERVASGLGVASADLPGQFDSLCSRGYKDAAAELRRLFIVKGYPPSLISQWGSYQVYVEMLGAYFVLQRCSPFNNYDRRGVEALDPRKEIMTAAALDIGDVAVAPPTGGSEVGGIEFGRITAVCEVEADARARGLFR